MQCCSKEHGRLSPSGLVNRVDCFETMPNHRGRRRSSSEWEQWRQAGSGRPPRTWKMCVCVCVHVFLYIYICIHTYIPIYKQMQKYMSLYIYAYKSVLNARTSAYTLCRRLKTPILHGNACFCWHKLHTFKDKCIRSLLLSLYVGME